MVVCLRPKADQGGFYCNQYDQIAVFRVGKEQLSEKFQLERRRRSRGNVWRDANVQALVTEHADVFSSLPGCKSVKLVADAISDVTTRRAVVLDMFCGRGTTILAAERTGRRAYALEVVPRFVDLTIRRWQAVTGQSAIHAETELTFEQHTRARTFAHEDVQRGRHS